ncbi:MAG: hypothetical protein GWM98_08020, partial [Nitrospinaceae bacterium]|nr:hypothetical protein [Nitrospinaceae bacterium]NIR54450.1 hypothetical protein [Nitrospinaceae bacterium]NIS84869.1 hypothetical protein [Nitrospinaceae bacterium]NIT81681.1 hypothetical protein [Nitrospinaceae bacterium]NIU43952.1 hypothetical protein [Nitrospinaceae bacterium]
DFDSLFSLNPYSLGYIYGFCNGSFVFHQIQQELEKFKFLTQVYSQLFSEAGSDIFQSTLNINEEGHPQFQEGTVSGFEEYLRWHYRKEQPVGLMRYTLRGEKTKTLAPHLIKY